MILKAKIYFQLIQMIRGSIVILTLLISVSCHEEKKLFTKMRSADTRIDFVNENHETETSNILTYEYFYNGGGIAVGDINNDGLADLYFTSNSGENKLYLNEGNLQFKDITASSGVAAPKGWKTGVSMVDVNSDGFLDIYVCRSGPNTLNDRTNMLFINNGDLTFKESAWRIRLNDPSYSTQAAFLDYDRDGDLDAFILNHSLLTISNSYSISQRASQKRYPHVGNRLLRNDNGKFIDVSDSVGIYGPASNYGLGVSLSDINNDGWIDIYTGCDYTGRDKLLLNKEGRFFLDATDSLLSHLSKFTMGTEIVDINNDGWTDIFTLDMLPEDNYRQKQLQGSDRFDEYNAMVKNGLHHQHMRNMLHLNHGNGSFAEVGQWLGISNTDWSWAALFADYDNDGVQDLFVTNGFKRDMTNNDFAKFQAFNAIAESRKNGEPVTMVKVIEKFTSNKIPNYIFQGTLDSAFRNMSVAWGIDEPVLSSGAAYADLDNDGDLDLIINNMNDKASIYRNNSEMLTRNSYLKVKLNGKDKNRNAVGARVTVFSNGKRLMRESLPVRGFQSSVDPILHFGLGKDNDVDSIVIRWPEGGTQRLGHTTVNQLLIVDQSATNEARAEIITPYLQKEQPSSFRHLENDFVDFKTQPLLPRMYSREGPAAANGDINGDGLMDYYFGGAAGQAGEIHLATSTRSFSKTNMALLEADKQGEDVSAVFLDVDNDQDQDLYVVTGGYDITDSLLLEDKLYINNGNGNYSKRRLPGLYDAGSSVTVADFDNDGDLDLFVGSRIVHARYPHSPWSRLLLNDGKGNFTEDLNFRNGFGRIGMVSDASASDLNGDGFLDLVIVGEWMPITILMNEHGTFIDSTSTYFSQPTEGFWETILARDFDEDGDMDFVVGNQGTNSQVKASLAEPCTLVYDDFDRNGSVDPIMNYFIQHHAYPYPSRDELTEQLPSFKRRFTTYDSYSKASIETVLSPEEYNMAKKFIAYLSESCYLRNENGKLVLVPMPLEMQFAPVHALAAMDVNGDGYLDLVTGGNSSKGRARTGKMTGNCGYVFVNNGNGEFSFLDPKKSGINVRSDVKAILTDGKKLVFAINDAHVVIYSLITNGTAENAKP